MKVPSLSLIVPLTGLLALVGLPDVPAFASDSAATLSAQALKECHKGRTAKARQERLAHFERGLALAERAVALNDRWAEGHFAIFCTLGERLRVDGESLVSLFGLKRVMAALDRTLELDPNHLEALSCKGTVLIRLPRLFGGDRDEGEQLLKRVIQRAPDRAVNARLVLARSYADRGSHEQAVSLAREALRIAHTHERTDLIPEARETLEKLIPQDHTLPSPAPLIARP